MRNKVVILVALLAAFLCIASLSPVASAQVQEYYVLGDEGTSLRDAYEALTTPTSGWMTGTVSIVAWEPVHVTQDKAPYGSVNNWRDLAIGEIWTISGNDLGGDIISANGSISVVRTAWRSKPGTFAAGTWELFPTNVWGMEYVVPIGTSGDNSSQLIVQAKGDGTTVTVTGFAPVTLNKGEDHHFANVNVGDIVTADKPVQAGIITCQDGNWDISEDPWKRKKQYETRFFTLTPRSLLGTDYYVPVPSFSVGDTMYSKAKYSGANASAWPNRTMTPVTTRLHIYAFSNTNVVIEDKDGTQTVPIAAGTVYSDYTMPEISGVYKNEGDPVPGGSYAAHISGDDTIWVVGTCDDNYPDFDWGFQCINKIRLSNDYYIPWSPANPVYVTPVEDGTTFYVDYDLNGVSDLDFTLDKLEMRMIYPRSTEGYELTGVHIWTDENAFAMQWGQDNNEDTPGERDFAPWPNTPADKDFGYTILPFRVPPPPGTVDGYVYEDPNCNCIYDQGEKGVENVTVELVNVTTGGIVNTTTTNNSGYYGFTNVTAGDYTVRYIVGTLPGHLSPKCDDGNDYINPTEGNVTVPEGGHDSHNFGVESEAGISIVKLVDGVESKLVSRNDMVTYTLNITNTGKVNLTNITVVDVLPDGLTWAGAASPVQDSVVGNTITWKNKLIPVLEPDEWFVITFNATVDSDAEFGKTCTNNATVNATSDWGDVSAYDTADVIIETPTHGIRIIKLVNGVNSITAARNETVTFTLNIMNIGTLNLTNLTVTDALPLKKANKGLTYADAANPPEDGLASSIDSEGWIHFTIHWWGYDTPPGSLAQFEPLKPGDSFVISFNATVDSDAEGRYRDVAAVTGESEMGDVWDSDDAFVFVGTHRVPVLTPFGVAALIGLLSLVAVLSISKSKGKGKRG